MSETLSDEELRAAYATRAAQSAHTIDCPAPDALHDAVRGVGTEAERLSVLDRALRCDECRSELALLQAVADPSMQAHTASAQRFRWQRYLPMAAAAMVLLALGVIGITSSRNRPEEPVMRSGPAAEPVLIAPAADVAAAAGPITFVWRAVPRAVNYTLELSAADGRTLFMSITTDTVAVAPAATPRAEQARWWVRAHLDDGTERRSETRLLMAR